MLLKGLPLLVFAIFIDLLQAGLSVGLLGVIIPVSWIPIIGQGAVGAGLLLGIAINTSVSLTAGVGHTFATFITYSTGRSRLKTKIEAMILRRVLFTFLGELTPVINNMPWWTISTLLTIRAVHKEERAAALEAEAKESTRQTVVPQTKVEDIRTPHAANANKPYAIAA